MESRRGNWEQTWEEIAERVLPRGDDFQKKHARGVQRTQHVYDSFPMLALTRFAAAMEAGVTPRTTRWHDLSTGDDGLDADQQVRAYLEEVNNRLWKARYAPQANFASQAHESYLSLGAFGTQALFVEAHPRGGVRYRSHHLSQIYALENAGGVIDIVHRKFEMSVRQYFQQFDRDDDEIPAKVRSAKEAGRMTEPFEVLHVVMPNDEFDPEALDDRGKRFSEIYLDCDSKQVIRRGGYYEFPWMISRYLTSPREVYGRGPGLTLLPDVKMLNEMRRTTDEGRQLAVPYQAGADVGLGLEMIADTRSQLDDGFLGVYFRVLLENPQMTATQALLIAQQQGQMTAPVIGRQQTEWLGPMLKRESGLLFRQGRIPPMPAQLAEYLQAQGESLRIEYESPMVRNAQAQDAVALLRTFETLAPFAQVDPSIYERFDPGEVAKLVAEVNGVPAKAMRSDEQMEALDQQQASQQAFAAALEAAPVAAQTAETFSRMQQTAQAQPQVPA